MAEGKIISDLPLVPLSLFRLYRYLRMYIYVCVCVYIFPDIFALKKKKKKASHASRVAEIYRWDLPARQAAPAISEMKKFPI